MQTVSKFPLLFTLSKAQRARLAGAMRVEFCPAGLVLLKANQRISKFYVVCEGECEAAPSARILGANAWFGEAALASNTTPSTEEVRVCATRGARLYSISHDNALSILSAGTFAAFCVSF